MEEFDEMQAIIREARLMFTLNELYSFSKKCNHEATFIDDFHFRTRLALICS